MFFFCVGVCMHLSLCCGRKWTERWQLLSNTTLHASSHWIGADTSEESACATLGKIGIHWMEQCLCLQPDIKALTTVKTEEAGQDEERNQWRLRWIGARGLNPQVRISSTCLAKFLNDSAGRCSEGRQAMAPIQESTPAQPTQCHSALKIKGQKICTRRIVG